MQLKDLFSNSKSVNSSVWITLGVVSEQAIRLLVNLALTRLLVPEFFGIMAIVYATQAFFNMVSDIGLFPSIVNSNRDSDPSFMETAWTIQVIRSVIVSIFIVVAAYPISIIYNQPELLFLLIAISITSLCLGFNSIALLVEDKYLRQKRRIIVNISIQLIVASVILITAYSTRSIWSLVIGNFVSCILLLICSYKLFGKNYSKFRLEKKSTSEIVHFGKWILLASFFGYLANQAAPLFIGKIITLEELGIYTIGFMLAQAAIVVSDNICGKVLFPKYRSILSGRGDSSAIKSALDLRTKFIRVFFIFPFILAIFGSSVVELLYDDRYIFAGEVLEYLALGTMGKLLTTSAQPILLAFNDSKRLLLNQLVLAVIRLGSIVVLGYLYGFKGVIIAGAVAPFFEYLVLSFTLLRYKVYILAKDLLLVIPFVLIILLIWQI